MGPVDRSEGRRRGDRAVAAVDVPPELAAREWVEREIAESVLRQLGVAVLICGNEHDARDVLADVALRMLRRARKTAICDPDAYARRAIANEAIDLARSRRRAEKWRARTSETRGTDDSLERAADALTVRAALKKLTPKYRVVVVLRYFADASEAEIARMIDIPVGTVKSRLSRGLDELRGILAPSQPTDPRAENR